MPGRRLSSASAIKRQSGDRMKRLLRGIIDIQGNAQSILGDNLRKLRSADYDWTNPADKKIYTFVSDFFDSSISLPAITTLRDYYTRTNDHETLSRLDDIESAHFYDGSDYTFILKMLREDQSTIGFTGACKSAIEIANKGLKVGEGKDALTLKGVNDAIAFIQEKFSALTQTDSTVQTRCELRESVPEVKDIYYDKKNNPDTAWGCMTGIEQLDVVCRGSKRGEMWTHAAFTGELKTTFAMTWALNLITRYRRNVFYVSLEMPRKQMLNLFCCMHSSNPYFTQLGYEPLSYQKVRDGQLSKDQEDFYMLVLDDLQNNEEYGRLEIWTPSTDVTIADIKREAEMIHVKTDLEFCVLDHGLLIVPDKKRIGKGTTEEINFVVREAKKMALHFNNGEGIAILMLFQINRNGKDEANKNNGRYELKALTYANEVEKSSDVVTTTYLNDELRDRGQTIFGNLKNRDNSPVKPFRAGVDFRCRRLHSLDLSSEMVQDGDSIAQDLNSL